MSDLLYLALTLLAFGAIAWLAQFIDRRNSEAGQ